MKKIKIGRHVTNDLKEIAEALPEVWVAHKVVHDAKGQFILNSGLPDNAMVRKYPQDYFQVSYSGWTFVNHLKKMREVVRMSKSGDDNGQLVQDYVDSVLNKEIK